MTISGRDLKEPMPTLNGGRDTCIRIFVPFSELTLGGWIWWGVYHLIVMGVLGAIAYVVVVGVVSREWLLVASGAAVVPWYMLFGIPLAESVRAIRRGGRVYMLAIGHQGGIAVSPHDLGKGWRCFDNPTLREDAETLTIENGSGHFYMACSLPKAQVTEAELELIRMAVQRARAQVANTLDHP